VHVRVRTVRVDIFQNQNMARQRWAGLLAMVVVVALGVVCEGIDMSWQQYSGRASLPRCSFDHQFPALPNTPTLTDMHESISLDHTHATLAGHTPPCPTHTHASRYSGPLLSLSSRQSEPSLQARLLSFTQCQWHPDPRDTGVKNYIYCHHFHTVTSPPRLTDLLMGTRGVSHAIPPPGLNGGEMGCGTRWPSSTLIDWTRVTELR
jgi:hypothetical protein